MERLAVVVVHCTFEQGSYELNIVDRGRRMTVAVLAARILVGVKVYYILRVVVVAAAAAEIHQVQDLEAGIGHTVDLAEVGLAVADIAAVVGLDCTPELLALGQTDYAELLRTHPASAGVSEYTRISYYWDPKAPVAEVVRKTQALHLCWVGQIGSGLALLWPAIAGQHRGGPEADQRVG
jgi:hypothetical protein